MEDRDREDRSGLGSAIVRTGRVCCRGWTYDGLGDGNLRRGHPKDSRGIWRVIPRRSVGERIGMGRLYLLRLLYSLTTVFPGTRRRGMHMPVDGKSRTASCNQLKGVTYVLVVRHTVLETRNCKTNN